MNIEDWTPINSAEDLPTAEEWERDFESGYHYVVIDKSDGDIEELIVHQDGNITIGQWDILKDVPRHYAILTNFAWTKIPTYKEQVYSLEVE